MKKIYLLIFTFHCMVSVSQTTTDAAVQLEATVQASPAQITLTWLPAPNSSQYQIFRKLKSASSWGTVLAILNGTTTQYVDNTVTAGISYEYKVALAGTNYSGNGYINAGIEIPETDFRGKILLIVDSTFITSLSSELNRLHEDLEGDGWIVIRRNLDRNGSAPHVRSVIQSYYNADPINTKAVFLLGHLPVPYSGFLNPDGHPDHYGAWPADVYYGDMNGSWTDASGPATSTASPPRTENNPGDGKFDQTAVTGVELQVGRVDLYDMPAFAATEQQLLKNYLDKDHAYRKKIYVPHRRSVIDDNFGYFSAEAFAASGYKNFAPLLGTDSIIPGDYITSLNSGSYLWSYGCGGGSYTSAGGIGNTASIAGSTLQGTFSMLFGSYFGDWDVTNSFLRAPLASGSVLTNVWSGRPHYQFHHMALGENIGYSFLTTQNYSGSLYFGSPYPITGKWVHNALMGDPSLRHDVVAPVSNVIAAKSGFDCIISWSATTETNIAGYNIYMKNDTVTNYVKINSTPVAGTSYTDECLEYKGVYKYMVRAIKLENTPSGSYYNMSEGISDTALNTSDIRVKAGFTAAVSGSVVNITNTSTNSVYYNWNISSQATSTLTNPAITFTANGFYNIQLTAANDCSSDTVSHTVEICNWPALAGFSTSLSGDTLRTYNLSQNTSGSIWTISNGFTSFIANPVTTFTATGIYTITLVAFNICSSDTMVSVINYEASGINEGVLIRGLSIYPNPTSTDLTVRSEGLGDLLVINTLGQVVLAAYKSSTEYSMHLSSLPPGVYILLLRSNEKTTQAKIYKH